MAPPLQVGGIVHASEAEDSCSLAMYWLRGATGPPHSRGQIASLAETLSCSLLVLRRLAARKTSMRATRLVAYSTSSIFGSSLLFPWTTALRVSRNRHSRSDSS